MRQKSSSGFGSEGKQEREREREMSKARSDNSADGGYTLEPCIMQAVKVGPKALAGHCDPIILQGGQVGYLN
jgi:hypothetical protein